MTCYQCGEEQKLMKGWLLGKPDSEMAFFCSQDCVRALIAPDRPLTRRVEEAENATLTPQHMVVEVDRKDRQRGESDEEYAFRIALAVVSDRE